MSNNHEENNPYSGPEYQEFLDSNNYVLDENGNVLSYPFDDDHEEDNPYSGPEYQEFLLNNNIEIE